MSFTNKTKGFIFGAIAAATYGMNPLFALPLYSMGMNADTVLLFRYVLAFPILALMIKWRGRSFHIDKKSVLPIFVLGLLMAASSYTLFESYNYMDSGIASTLLFVYPMMVALIMTLFFHERLTLSIVICMLVALGGVALLNRTASGEPLNPTGVAIVMISALVYAIYIVGINRPDMKKIPTITAIFYVIFFGSFLFVGRLLLGGVFTPPPFTLLACTCLICLAVLPTAVSLICTTRAIQFIGPTPTAVLGALEPLVAVFFAVTVFGDALTLRQTIGMILVLAAVTFVVAGGSITGPLIRFRHMFPSLRRKRAKS